MSDLNEIQMQIIKELTFKPSYKFSDIKPYKITSDKFSYHLKALQDLNLIIKSDSGEYSLSTEGKKFATTIDMEVKKVEKLPKNSVLLIVKRDDKFAIQRRMKEPYIGFLGFITGKIKFGETLIEAANRELEEECQIKANFKYQYTFHELTYQKSDNLLLEDKYFYCMVGAFVSGDLSNTEGAENVWMSIEDFRKAEPKYHNEIEILELYLDNFEKLFEKKYFIEKF
ncbi:NUDIX domain-containing protein [bacterium]|nr:MAG: NUDIX domain-containing protein [bacterium]